MIANLIYIIFAILFLLAIKWEIDDQKRIGDLPYITEITGKKQKERHYRLLAKFPYENAVSWRMTYITSVFALIMIVFIMRKSNISIDKETALVIFLSIFLGFHLSSSFTGFHLYRVLASKIDPHITTI